MVNLKYQLFNHETRDLSYEGQTSKTSLKRISGECCDTGGEIIFTQEESNTFYVRSWHACMPPEIKLL